jgi:hypothetical protein
VDAFSERRQLRTRALQIALTFGVGIAELLVLLRKAAIPVRLAVKLCLQAMDFRLETIDVVLLLGVYALVAIHLVPRLLHGAL